MKTQKGKVRFITLGCRVNQYETQGMREILEQSGFESVQVKNGAGPGSENGSTVDYVVINTCTVTGGADRESRYWIRRARRDYPHARIAVTGCGVERDREVIERMPEVDLIFGNTEKLKVADWLQSHDDRSAGPSCEPAAPPAAGRKGRRKTYLPFSIARSEGRTRAFVKIQDGCNHACSFCKVVLVRGRSRSREPAEIVKEVYRLRDSGYKDVVLTGIQLGAYGLDLLSKTRRMELPDVLEACSRIEGIERLRMSSIEPTDIRPSLISAIRGLPECAPHLHIPLQSGDDAILRRMNRRYDGSFYQGLIDQLRSEIPDFMLTLDVMAGFPGEDEGHFQNTLALLRKLSPLKCHVFPYSRREGTRAAEMGSDVPPAEIRRRVKRLLQLENQLGLDAMRPYVGKVMPVLVEGTQAGNSPGGEMHLQGLTANSIRVRLRGHPGWAGRILPVRMTDLGNHCLVGEPLESREHQSEVDHGRTFEGIEGGG